MKTITAVLLLVGSCLVSRGAAGAEPFLATTDVFVAGGDGICEYRIPALVTTGKGTLIAVCDARVEERGDPINNIDLAMKRSTDNGRTWGPLTILADFPDREAAADSCMLVDRAADTVWVMYDYVLGEPDDSGRRQRENRAIALHMIHSRDDGQTWSKPTDITATVKQPDWEAVMSAPGSGIQTRDGRLVFPCYTRRADEDYSHVLCSSDHGRTWRISHHAASKVNECQVVELADGSWMLNMRSGRGQRCRAVAATLDAGAAWGTVADDSSLPEPGCQASLLRYTGAGDRSAKNRLLFANPASASRRFNMTVRLSYDEGKTWPISKTIHTGPSAYSCLTVLQDGTIGLLYENGRDSAYEKLTFARFNLEWLTDGRDSS